MSAPYMIPRDPSWWLQVPVITKDMSPATVRDSRPRLFLTGLPNSGENEVLGLIQKDTATTKGAPAVWTVREWISDPDRGEHRDDRRVRFGTTLEEGETRTPRPTPEAALDLLLQIAGEAFPTCRDPALRVIGLSLLRPFREAAEAYGRRVLQLPR